MYIKREREKETDAARTYLSGEHSGHDFIHEFSLYHNKLIPEGRQYQLIRIPVIPNKKSKNCLQNNKETLKIRIFFLSKILVKNYNCHNYE